MTPHFLAIIGFAILLCYVFLQTYAYLALLLIGYIGYKYSKRLGESRIDANGRGVLVTGCDTGIGHHIAIRLDSLGFVVFAGCLDADGDGATQLRSSSSGRMHVIQMDVTNDDHVINACNYVSETCKGAGLWGLINNAAINGLGDVELVAMETIKRVAEVNYYGMLRVTKTFLPMIKASKGRIVNVTSVRGRIAVPTCVSYTPTKWAGEAFSDILRREMHRFGVKVIIIEPGNFGGLTGMLNRENIARNVQLLNTSWEAATQETRNSYGRDYVDSLINGLKECGKTTHPTLKPVINGLEHALTSTHPQCRYLIHGGKRLLDWYCVVAYLNPYLPEELMDYILRVIDPLPKIAGNR